MKFSELGLSAELLSAIEKHGYQEATPIQELTIPLILGGRDVIGQAQTGTGKTAAFGLPILEHIDTSDKSIQALIVSPTRELAMQTQEELARLGKEKGVRSMVVFGGSDIRRQMRQLKDHPHIVVGTPGRLIDHLNRHTLKINQLKTLVLDEADEMLNMGFLEDIETIIKNAPAERQTLLFSATMPPAIKRIGVQFMENPEHVQVAAKEVTTDLVDQYYVNSQESEKFNTMTRLIDVAQPDLAIVFGRTKRRVDELTRGLELRGYRASGIHGDLSQQARTRTFKQFKSGELDILVATDVAARGLDISGVTHVYNYDIPQDPESYVHRIGRTGRAGQHGTSITFVTRDEQHYLREIEKLTKKRMGNLKPPTAQDARVGRLQAGTQEVEELLKKASSEGIETQVAGLVDQYTPQQLAAALLHSAAGTSQSEAKVEIARERPLPRKGGNGGGRRSGGGHRRDDRRGGNSGGSRGRNDRRGGSSNGGGRRRRNDFDPNMLRDSTPADRRGQRRKPRPNGERKAKPVKREFKVKKKTSIDL